MFKKISIFIVIIAISTSFYNFAFHHEDQEHWCYAEMETPTIPFTFTIGEDYCFCCSAPYMDCL